MGTDVEILNTLKKILGKLPRSEFSSYDKPLDRMMDMMSAREHEFLPEISVDDTGTSVDIEGYLYSIGVSSDSTGAVKVNLDREIGTEYSVVFPGTVKTFSRISSRLYLKALPGQTATVTIEAMKLGT